MALCVEGMPPAFVCVSGMRPRRSASLLCRDPRSTIAHFSEFHSPNHRLDPGFSSLVDSIQLKLNWRLFLGQQVNTIGANYNNLTRAVTSVCCC